MNGKYKYLAKEIVLYEKNFGGDINLLMYTAIHEYAHYIMVEEYQKKSTRAHTTLFYKTFDDLLDKAEKLSLYESSHISAELDELVNEIKNISLKLAEEERTLGKLITKTTELCKKEKIRPDDILLRQCNLSRQTVRISKLISLLPETGVELGFDMQQLAAKQTNFEDYERVIYAADKGLTVDQVRQSLKPAQIDKDQIFILMLEIQNVKQSVTKKQLRLAELEAKLVELQKLKGYWREKDDDV
jgi:hypothetical protein